MSKKITIITSFFRADEYIDHYLKNIKNIVGYRTLCIHHAYNILGSHKNDNSVTKKLKEFLKEYDNFELMNIEKDPGLYSLWNRSCQTANTPYMMTLNIDDMCEPKYVVTALYEINKYKGDLISCPIKVTKNKNTTCNDYYTIWYNTKKIYFDKRFDRIKQLSKANIIRNKKGQYYEISCNRRYKYFSKNIDTKYKNSVMVNYKFYSLEDMFIDWSNNNNYISYCISHCMPIWKRDMHDKYGYFNEEKYGVYADFEFWLRLLNKDRRFIQMNHSMVLYVEDENSHNRRNIKKNEYMDRIISKYL
mgnify:CR=1 FL=1|jgi:hypothetical protein